MFLLVIRRSPLEKNVSIQVLCLFFNWIVGVSFLVLSDF